MTATLRVLAPGPLTTLQDGGRRGWLRFGVPESGPLDIRAMAIANALVANPPDAPALEMTLAGLSFAVEDGTLRFAVAGADMALTIDGTQAARGRSHTVTSGTAVRVGAARKGARAYLAVSGGFVGSPAFGSVATHLRSGIGGRALAAGDTIVATGAPTGPDLRLGDDAMPPLHETIRVVLGPQDDYFTADAIATLLSANFTVTARADRMGCRLAGPPLAHAKGFNIVSDGIAPGSIQVPGDGQPIILLADRQTTGGYPKIATVISADLAALGQKRPGDTLSFEAVDLDQARAARRALTDWLAALPRLCKPMIGEPDTARLLAANLISGVTDGGG